MTKDRQHLGRHGENQVLAWYLNRGAELLDQNWRARDGELDLVVQIGSASQVPTVVFCEVKTRARATFGNGFDAVGYTKQRQVRRVALVWLAQHPAVRQRAVRFDVASVVGGKVEVIENAF